MSDFSKTYRDHTQRLFEAFAAQLAEARAKGDAPDETVIAAVPVMFDKWLRSAVIDGTLLTPLNLLSAYEAHERGRDGLMPVPYGINGLPRLIVADFGAAKHPIIADTRRLMAALETYNNLDDPYYDEAPTLESFAVPTSGYIAFVADTAARLGVIKKLPSLNARVYSNDGDDEPLTRDSDELIRLIARAVVAGFAAAAQKFTGKRSNLAPWLQQVIASPVPTAELFRELMGNTEPIDTDRVADVFENESESDALSELMGEVFDMHQKMSEIGRLLEKRFFTPLDRYLGIIRSASFSPANPAQDIAAAADAGGAEAYALCAGWQLTSLGERLYGKRENPYSLPPCHENAEKLLKALRKGGAIPRKLLEQARAEGARTAIIELRPGGKRRTPSALIEFLQSAPLRDIFSCAAMTYGLDPFSEFTIFEGDSESPFHAYSSAAAPIAGKNAETAAVSALAGRACRLVVYGDDERDDKEFKIKFTGEAAARYGFLYPRQVEDDEG